MNVHVVDPSAYTRAYDHALCEALAEAGANVELITSRFGYGPVASPSGYSVRELFYRGVPGRAGSRLRSGFKLLWHGPDMARYRRLAAHADVVHFQWLPVQWLDLHLLPRRPLVLTAHDLLPREARPGQSRAQRRLYDAVDAVIVHSEYGRRALVGGLGVDEASVHVIHHGAFGHLTSQRHEAPLPAQLREVDRPVVLFFGLLRPYKGIERLLEAWRGIGDAELWIVGHPRMSLGPLRASAPPGVRFVPRYVDEAELPAYFRRADIVVLPYERTERFDQSGVLATALAFGKAIILSDVGSFHEIAGSGAARLVGPGDSGALHEAIVELLADRALRERLGAAARELATGWYSWEHAAARTLSLYESLV
jgi:glycosyltransferase involved in cell wall biosynthesis